MSRIRLAERTRQRLRRVLGDDRPEPDALVARLRSLRDLDGVPAFAAAMHHLAHLDLSDKGAEKLLGRILDHRAALGAALGRDPGLRVAVADYLSNVEARMSNPVIVESSQFERTERSAITDSLTGLYNRRFFASALKLEVRRSRRYGLDLSLVMLDLDGFKKVNDEHGHGYGDEVLRRVGRVVRKATRDSDMACRYGGEEFSIILPETERLGAHAVAERIRRRTASLDDEGDDRLALSVTVSGGVACFPADARDADDLVVRADQALYRAKESGRDRIALHHAERRSSVRFPARRSVRVELAGRSEADGRPVKALDLSRDGMLVESTRRVEPAAEIRVVLGGSSASEGSSPWTVPGRVVRVLEAGPGAWRVGIRFDHRLPEPLLRAQVRPLRSTTGASTGSRT